MLKISLAGADESTTTLRLEGRIIGPWVDELRQIGELALSEGRGLKLDLADVSFVDEGGLATLTSFKSRGAIVANCSPFVEEQLKAAAHAGPGGQSSRRN